MLASGLREVPTLVPPPDIVPPPFRVPLLCNDRSFNIIKTIVCRQGVMPDVSISELWLGCGVWDSHRDPARMKVDGVRRCGAWMAGATGTGHRLGSLVMATNRQAIMEAAERLFGERGYAGTSVRDILQIAGTKPASLYYHFGSKEDLFVQLFIQRLGDYCDALDAALGDAATPEEVFRRCGEFVLRGIRDEPTRVRFVFTTYFGPHAEVPAERLAEVQDRYDAILPRHLLRTRPDTEPEHLWFVSHLFYGMLTSALLRFIGAGIQEFPDRLPSVLAEHATAILGKGEHDGVPWPAPAGFGHEG